MEHWCHYFRRNKIAILRACILSGCFALVLISISHPVMHSLFPKKLPDLLKSRDGFVQVDSRHYDVQSGTKEENQRLPQNSSSRAAFVHIFEEDMLNYNATCVDYTLLKPLEGTTKLCVHRFEDDVAVSGTFLKGGHWERNHLIPFGVILHAHPNMVFLDIGSHMGTYTMYANKVGNQVIAIDPLMKNLRLLRKSVQMTHQEKNIVILLNAVSNKHEKLHVQLGGKENIGSTYLVGDDKTLYKPLLVEDYRIQTILLDDLLEVFNLDGREVIMKMDVEGSEWKALQGGYEFFRRVNVCYVMLEFTGHKATPDGQRIVDFMKSFNMFPYTEFDLKQSLAKGFQPQHYPVSDVIFAKNTRQCMKQK